MQLRTQTDNELVEKSRLLAGCEEDLKRANKEIAALTEAVAREVEKRVALSVEEEERSHATPTKQGFSLAAIIGSPAAFSPSTPPHQRSSATGRAAA